MTETATEIPAPIHYMRSPEGVVVEVLPSAFDGVWRHKGFEAVTDEDGLAAFEAIDLAREQAETSAAPVEEAPAAVPPRPTPTSVAVPPRPVTDNPQA